jgi:N-acetylmuramoyl-L-alanine amidase
VVFVAPLFCSASAESVCRCVGRLATVVSFVRATFHVRCLFLLLLCACSDSTAIERAHQAEQALFALSAPHTPSGVEAASPTPGARVTGVTVYGAEPGATRVRAVLQLEGTAPFRRRERPSMAGLPRSLVFDFEGAALGGQARKITPVGRAGLVRVVLDEHAQGVSAFVELDEQARYQLFVIHDPLRVVLDVESAREQRQEGKPLVLIDAGHGGDDYGSPGPFGLWEGTLTLDISRRVRAWLAQLAPHVRVRMTRDSNVYITLEERAAMANALSADLFVSVHLNAANTTVDKGGVATYVLDVSNDRNVLRLAARENGSTTHDVSPLQFLVGSLARSEQRQKSEALATLVQRGTLASARRILPNLADRGVKSAMFYVLVGAQMPAILVEGSFITQPDEAAELRTPVYRDALAEGIARGIAKYLADN